MSAFANSLKTAFLSKSEDLSAIWTVLNEEERKSVFAKVKEQMLSNSL